MELNINGLTQEQLDSIKKQIEVFEKENEKPKDVIDYENGWVFDSVSFKAVRAVMKIDAYTRTQYALGLYRDTKEECEKLIKKMKIEHRLRQWSKMCKDKVDWLDDGQKKYYLLCDINYDYFSDDDVDEYTLGERMVVIDDTQSLNGNDIYFTDKSILQKAINDIGEQKLIDEYFVEV